MFLSLYRSFLREWADAIDAGELEATSAVLVAYVDRGAQFQICNRRCNADVMRTIAILEITKTELIENG